MFSIIIDLLLICLFVTLIYRSGFWDNLDDYISRKVQFYHLPYILTCSLCQTWWLSLLYIIVTGNLSILTLVLCIINAHLSKVMIPLTKTIENILMKIIELINRLIDLC